MTLEKKESLSLAGEKALETLSRHYTWNEAARKLPKNAEAFAR